MQAVSVRLDTDYGITTSDSSFNHCQVYLSFLGKCDYFYARQVSIW